jgi:hypothetical protein
VELSLEPKIVLDLPTESLTLSTAEYHSVAVASSLSDILETGDVPQRYFLSAKACRGILRRAEKRGKKLPEQLRVALESVAIQIPATETEEDSLRSQEPLGGGYGDRGLDIDSAGAFIPFTTSSHANYDKGIGTLRSNGGDIGGGSETLLCGLLKSHKTLDTQYGTKYGQENPCILTQEHPSLSHAVTCHQAKGGDPTTDNYVVTRSFFDDAMETLACSTVVYPIADMATRHSGTDGSGHQNGKGHGLGIGDPEDPMYTLTKGDKHAVAHSICLGSNPIHGEEVAMPQTTRNGDPGVGQKGMAVRRLTPRECERLQGFKDDYTKISDKTADGPRYKALGNSFAVPVVRWIAQRILEIEKI